MVGDNVYRDITMTEAVAPTPEEPLPAKALEEPLPAKAVEAPAPTPTPIVAVAAVAPEGKRKRLADDMRMDPNEIPGERISRGEGVPVAGLESLLFINMQYKWATRKFTDVSMVPFGNDQVLRQAVVAGRMKIHNEPQKYEISFQRNFHVYAFQCMEFG